MAQAAPFTYRLTGDFSGSLGGTGFSGAAVTWTLNGDTANVTTLAGVVPAVPGLSETLDVAGFGAVVPGPQIYSAANVTAGIDGFVDFGVTEGLSWTATALVGYGETTAIGPLPVTFDGAVPFVTDQGVLDITGGTSLVFAAFPTAVPEPATWAMLPLALGMLGLARRRRPRRVGGLAA